MQQKGYALVELLVVIAIIGILSAGVVFSLGYSYHNKLESSARILASDLLWARFTAISEGVYYKVEFYPSYKIKKWEYRIIEGLNQKIVKKVLFEKGIHIISVNFPDSGGNLYFYPNGSPSSGGTITLQDSRVKFFFVKVEAAVGRIRVTDKDE